MLSRTDDLVLLMGRVFVAALFLPSCACRFSSVARWATIIAPAVNVAGAALSAPIEHVR